MGRQFTANLKYWSVGALVVAVLAVGGGYGLMHKYSGGSGSHASDQDQGNDDHPDIVTVQVVSPQLGGMDRTTTQPGTVIAEESVPLYAAVSGYLKKLNVDIGSLVKKDQVLAVIDVPELDFQLKWNKAAVKRAEKKVDQMRALKKVYEADLTAAKAAVKQACAAAKTTETLLTYHKMRFDRLAKLGERGTIDAGVVDEAQQRYEAAVEAVNAATEATNAAEARKNSVAAKVEQGQADIDESLAAVEVAEAERDKTQELVNYATIKAPFDGVITQRSVFEKHFIRAATINANQPPLLTVDRTDKVRIVVMIPDRDILYTDVGDEARIEIDAWPGHVFKAPIARFTRSEDAKSRTMRVEIDMDNPNGKLCQGMYGKVTITLEKSANVLALPSSCVFNRTDNKGQVYVVRDRHAALTTVTVIGESGYNVGVVGLKATDQVITNPQVVPVSGVEVAIVSPKK
jgi:RND family efflux transporter MFP subunit